jgi:hypothetical protein
MRLSDKAAVALEFSTNAKARDCAEAGFCRAAAVEAGAAFAIADPTVDVPVGGGVATAMGAGVAMITGAIVATKVGAGVGARVGKAVIMTGSDVGVLVGGGIAVGASVDSPTAGPQLLQVSRQ